MLKLQSQSDWETESLRCDEDDVLSDDDEEEAENLTPVSREKQKQKLIRRQNARAKCAASQTVPHKVRKAKAPRGRPRCDSESSIRTLSSARPSCEKRRPRLQGSKKSDSGATPKCCRFLDLTHVDDDVGEKSQQKYEPYHISEYYDDQPDDFDRYLEDYQATIDKSIRSSPGESDATWSADEGEPILSRINLIWQELMSNPYEDTRGLQFLEGNENLISSALHKVEQDLPSSMANWKHTDESLDKAPSQVVPVLPDVPEPYNFLSISLTADGSLASSGDLSDDLKDIDLQPIFPDMSAEAALNDSAVERICKQELNISQDQEDSQPYSTDGSQAAD